MTKKDIVVIGTSAGGIDALRTLVRKLPSDFPAAIFVVVHTAADSPGILAGIIERAGELPAVCVREREVVAPGRIYVPPPDHHLVVEPGMARATRGPKENRFRPAVDPLFRSAAQAYGPRVIGIILTGGLDDGTAGLLAVKKLGGTAIVQDPDDAVAPSMPRSALTHVEVDHCVALADLPPLLVALTGEPAREKGVVGVPEQIRIEVDIAAERDPLHAGVSKLGEPSIYACPECHGVMLRVKADAGEGALRFRCHTGHAYSLESLLEEIGHRADESLGNSLRALDEHLFALKHLASHTLEGTPARDALSARVDQVEAQRDLIRRAMAARPQQQGSGVS